MPERLPVKTQQPQLPATPWLFIKFALRPHQFLLWSAVMVVVVAAGTSQGTSYFFKLIVDAVEQDDMATALMWGMLYPVAILCVQLLYRLSGYLGSHVANNASKTAYDAAADHLFQHSHTFFINRFAGSVTNKLRNIVGALEETIPDFLWSHLNALVTFIVTFALIATVDVLSSFVFVSLLVVLIIVNQRFAQRKAALAKATAEAGTALQARLSDVVGNVSIMRQYVQYQAEATALRGLTEQKRVAAIRNWMYTERLLLVNSLVLFVFSMLLFWILIQRWASGAIGTGDFVLVLALVSQITGLLLFVGRAFNSTARTIGELREGLEEITIPYEVVDVPNAPALACSGGQTSWQNVTFEYGENKVFKDFSLTIPAGQRLGLVGPSGAGKSTFVSLLLRQHDVTSGSITIDGQPIHLVTQDSLRQNIAVVPQEPALFHRTIRENIAYGKPDATDEDIIAVAKKAQAHEFISTLPDGYDTLVGERGVKLSGGQKQRVAIARAMLKDAPILILDEATSALDSESEAAIQKALHVLMAGKTVIAIAHRLSTLREMDRIIVLENGFMVEDGSHETLKHTGGTYSRLWEHQVGGFMIET